MYSILLHDAKCMRLVWKVVKNPKDIVFLNRPVDNNNDQVLTGFLIYVMIILPIGGHGWQDGHKVGWNSVAK